MRSISIIAVIFLIFSAVAFGDYEEKRDLSLPTANIQKFVMECGAGSLEVQGVEGISSIEITARIVMEGFGKNEAMKFIQRNLNLELKARGSTAYLKSEFEDNSISFWSLFRDKSAHVDLLVKVPKNLTLDISDGSGDLSVQDMAARVSIEDGSGDITVTGIDGDLTVEDGSGGIDISTIKGEIEINDGSGDLKVEEITGNVEIDDGSGEIRVAQIDGSVRVDDGSGDIYIDKVRQDVNILSSGSGENHITNVEGHVHGDSDTATIGIIDGEGELVR